MIWVLTYLAIAWVIMLILAMAEVRTTRRDELAAAATTALLWPVIPLVVAWLFATAPRGFWRRRARSEN